MRKNRGNIILTSLFIAIFLFFLSVALIYTNRQDIALSLAMEHKMKAQSAARSMAYEAFARLREFGDLGVLQEMELPNGTKATVELVAVEASGLRGEVLRIKAKGQSGPLTSYLTLHCLDNRIAGKANENESRVLFFPQGLPVVAQPASNGSITPIPANAASDETAAGKAIYGDFILREAGEGARAGMRANSGPVFAKSDYSQADVTTALDLHRQTGTFDLDLPYFVDYVPIFGGDGISLSGWHVYVMAPPFSAGKKSALRYLKRQGEEFVWEEIGQPESLGDELPKEFGLQAIQAIHASPADTWTTATTQGREDKAWNYYWKTDQPPGTRTDLDPNMQKMNPVTVTGAVDWSQKGLTYTQQKFITRGQIYPQKEAVYTHGWHYVYVPYRGGVVSDITPLDASTLIRWPCVLKYEIGGSWSKVWTSMNERGEVRSRQRPDPNVLLVTDSGTIYSVTEPEPGKKRRLLTISGHGVVNTGDVLPEGELILYQGKPYLISEDSSKPGLIDLLGRKDIGFTTLPNHLPEISGEVVDISISDTVAIGIEGGYAGEALDSTLKRTVTARPRYDFTYSIVPNSQVATEGDDLWAILEVDISMLEPSFEKEYKTEPYREGQKRTLARYDGDRWHILPGGLRALLNGGPGAPGGGVVAARYPGLPKQVSRYTIISEDTDPF